MSDEKRIQLNELISISADDWKKFQHQIEKNKERLDFYSKSSSSFFEESRVMRNRLDTIESWKESLMFWLKFVVWSVFVVVAFFLISTAIFVFKNEDIRVQYINKIIKPLPGGG